MLNPPKASGQSSQLALSWDRVQGGEVIGYRLYYRTAGSGSPYNGTGADQGPSPINVGDVNQYTITGLDPNRDHEFTVSAYNSAGESGLALPVRVFAIVCDTGANGQIDYGGSSWVASGGTKTINIAPANGYMIADVVVDGSSVGPVFSYSFRNVSQNHTVAASFVEDDPGGGGGGGDVDTDRDGLTDNDEQNIYGTNPINADTDNDGLSDGEEVLSFGTDPINADTDGDGFSDGDELAANSDPLDRNETPNDPPPTQQFAMEFGEVEITDQWTRVSFESAYSNPVVVANGLSYNGRSPSVVRIRNITNTGFQIRVQEWDYLDGSHLAEQVGYMVMEAGSHTLNGAKIVAGYFSTNRTSGFGRLTFPEPFDVTPVVVSAVVTNNGNDAVCLRQRRISRTNFRYQLQEQESSGSHLSETIAYIACEPIGGADGDVTFEVGRSANAITHNLATIQFDEWYYNRPPVIITGMQTTDGNDTASLRWLNKGAQSVQVFVEEEQSHDSEVNHTSEVVGYFIFGAR